MKVFLIVVLLPFSMHLFGQDVTEKNCPGIRVKTLSVLGDSVRLSIPERFRTSGHKFYSETISFDTIIDSRNNSEYLQVVLYDFTPWEGKNPRDVRSKLKGMTEKHSSMDSIITCEIKKIGDIEVGIFKLLFKREKRKKIFCTMLFNFPDSRYCEIRMMTQYTKVKNAEMDCLINSLMLK